MSISLNIPYFGPLIFSVPVFAPRIDAIHIHGNFNVDDYNKTKA